MTKHLEKNNLKFQEKENIRKHSMDKKELNKVK